MTTTRTITVRFTEPGFHRWEGATGDRRYLADRHRHLFHVDVTIAVLHDDREIEFHDLLDQCRAWWLGPELGAWSCEHIAQSYLGHLVATYPNRHMYQVAVFEDNEVGATLSVAP